MSRNNLSIVGTIQVSNMPVEIMLKQYRVRIKRLKTRNLNLVGKEFKCAKCAFFMNPTFDGFGECWAFPKIYKKRHDQFCGFYKANLDKIVSESEEQQLFIDEQEE